MPEPRLLAGALGLGALGLAVALGPALWPLDPAAIDPDPLAMLRARNQPPGWAHPLGTDQLGRDMLARLLQGGRISLAVGLAAMALAVSLGTAVGVAAGRCRRLDGPLMRLTDAFLSLPLLPLLMVLAMLFAGSLTPTFGASGGAFLLITGAIGLTAWMPVARVVRTEVARLNALPFLQAARAMGAGEARLIRGHILPNLSAPISVAASLCVAEAIVLESTLSFLGLGFPPDVPSWGGLLQQGLDDLARQPGRALWPGAAIALTVLSVTLLGEGLRRALDPRLR